MADIIAKLGDTAAVLVGLAILIFAGFLMTRITKKLKLPNVTGYILAGVLAGPYVLNLIPPQMAAAREFVTNIALAYIAFGVGKYFKLSTLRKTGPKIIILTLTESLGAAVVISLVMIFIFRLPVPFSILLAAIGCATAPASTIMTIRQYRAKGSFVNTILQVVALDDAVALLAFSVCTAVTQAMSEGKGMDYKDVLMPIVWNIAALVLSTAFGFLLNKLINSRRSQEHRISLVNGFIFALAGFCCAVNISPLLSCMMFGTVYINLNGNKSLFKQVNGFNPPILLIFFVLSGANLNVPSLVTAGVIGVVYFFVRIVGKYAGASLGGALCKFPPDVTKYLGLALIPQAGVSIGLAALGQKMLSEPYGTMLSTIILSSGVLYEMIGPVCAKLSLFLSRSIPAKTPGGLPAPLANRLAQREEQFFEQDHENKKELGGTQKQGMKEKEVLKKPKKQASRKMKAMGKKTGGKGERVNPAKKNNAEKKRK